MSLEMVHLWGFTERSTPFSVSFFLVKMVKVAGINIIKNTPNTPPTTLITDSI